MSVTTRATLLWTCWYRSNPGSPWRKIGEADSEREAWHLVLRYELSGDKTICRSGVNPIDRRPT
ncbi:MAG TPA: hypothetical protein VKA46_25195 [Gemmataceae bacterium]|nr:hypothetical protein [Gemmataceae bacterium]